MSNPAYITGPPESIPHTAVWAAPGGRDANGWYRNRFGRPVDLDGVGPQGYGGSIGRPYLGPPVLPHNPRAEGTECAEHSQLRPEDDPDPRGCRFCGHRECSPFGPCMMCRLTVRVAALEALLAGA